MENKSNFLNRIKRQQREKVLRYSIRKYSFGAASVAVAALMFLGARVASADSVLPNAPQSNTANAGVVNPKDKVDSPVDVAGSTENKVDAGNQALTTAAPSASTVDKAKLKKVVEELNVLLSTKLNLDESVVSPVKDRLQKGKEALESSELAQKDIDELVELLSKDVTVVSAAKEATEVQVDKQADKTEKPADNLASQTSPEVSASEESQTVSAKKDALKVSVDQLQAAVLELPEHETSKEVLEKANELLGLAQGVLENTTVSLNDVEDMTKRVKRMFTSVKNATTRLNSGARDSRNGQRMAQGTQFRAYTATSSSGAMKNVRYFASVDKNTNGGSYLRNDNPEFTERKTVVKSRYEQNSSGRWMVYDVYFNNNGKAMVDQSYGQHYYFQPPFNIMDPSNTVRDLTITRYRNVDGNPNRKLSDGGSGFQQVGSTVTISDPWHQKDRLFDNDRRSLYDPNSGVTRENQKWYVFKRNQNDVYLDSIVRKTDGNYTGGVSYTLGMEVGKVDVDYAIHMTARVKLRDNVTDQQAANGNVYAASVTSGLTTNQSYIVGSRGTSVKAEPDAPKDPIQGLTVTKTVGDALGDPDDPANSGYVRHKYGKPFPPGMTWSWVGDVKPTSTAQAGVFKYTSVATYQDGTKSTDANSGSDGRVTVIVKPKPPVITPNLEHKKGLPNQQITVNVGNGVPNNSKVNIYDGDRIIGTGTTNGQTATVTVKEPLPGKPLKAETVVTNNNGTVTSDKSNPVTPTEAPDNQPPTLTISRPSQEVVEGENVTFTLTARDNKVVNIDFNDFANKYLTRVQQQKASYTYTKNTPEEKVIEITITTEKGDVGKENKIEFRANDGKLQANNGKPVTFTFTVTSRDKIAPTITAGDATVTKNEPITPIPVTAVDNPGGVGMRDKTPIEVSGLPKGLTYTNGKITGTPTGPVGNSTVTIKAYDKNGNKAEKTITITVKDQASKYNPTGDSLTVNQGQPITDEAVKAKVTNFGPGTLTVESKPTSTATAGNAGNAVVKVTYSDGSSDTVNVPVTVKDVTGPTITANDATVTKNEPITPIPVTAVDNTGGVGMRDNNPIQVSNLPQGLKYEKGQITGTTNAKTGFYTVKITAYDKNNTASTKSIRITVQDQTDKYNPTGDSLTVNQGQEITDEAVKAKVTNYGPGTLTVESKPTSTATAGDAGNAVVKVTYPDGSTDTVNVPVTVKDVTGPTITAESATVTKNTPITPIPVTAVDNTGGVGMRDNNPIQVSNLPQGLKYENGQITGTTNAKTGFYTVKITAYDKNNTASTKTIRITVQDQLAGTATGKTVPEKTPVPANTKVVTPNRPGTTITVDGPVNGLTVDNGGNLVGTPKVTDWGPKEEEKTVEIPVKLKNGTEEVVVKVPITIERDTDGDGTPDKVDSDDDNDGIPDKDEENNGTDPKTPTTQTPTIEITRKPNGDAVVTPKKPDGSTYPSGSKVVIPGENNTPIEVTIGDNGSGEVPNDKLPKKDVPGTGTVTEPNKKPSKPVDVTTPARKTPKLELDQDPKTGDVTVTPKKPDGSTYPPGTTVEIPGENGTPITVTIGENGSGKVPNDNLPKKDVPGTGKITEPGQPTVEVPVETPAKVTPETPTTEKPVAIEITRKPNGDAVVTPKKPDGSTYPPGTTVEIPGENGTPITVTIGENGSGKVPNDNLPKKDVPGTGKITEPGQPTVEVPVETPAKVTPETPVTEKPVAIEITRKPNGDAVVTPKKPDGSTYPPGTTVEIPGENGTPITVTVGDNGSGEVPNDNLPKKAVPGTGKVTEPNKKPSQPVDVTTPAQKTPTLDVEQDPKTGDVTVTPKKPDGSTYPPGTKVEIPGKDGPITVEIGENGKGKVPNSELPEGKVPGTGKITEPGKPAVEVPNVTTPAKVIPETPTTEKPVAIEITRKPNGDAIVTPKKPDGSTYPSGSKVVIPGENNTPIEVTIGDNGSGEVPNDNLPKKAVPGTGTVTEPNKKPSQPVDVTTPAQKTPTLDVEQDPKTGDVTVTPKKPDGSTFPPGTTVEIPGEDGPITVEIGENGKGKVPNDKLPKKDVPGTGEITEPGQPTVEVPNVTTPAKVTPETPTTEKPVAIEITRKPNGDAVVTPKKPDGSTYPSGSKVVIPGENNTPIEVTIGDNGSGEVPNDKLPKKDVPGTGTVTEPNKKPSQPVDVTTPAQKTPTLD
ncbi:hypothetical protein SK667_0698, partial [Streptococcus mitis]